MTRRILIALLITALAVPAAVVAQPPGSKRMHERARTFLVLRLSELLDLDDATALEVSRILRDSGEERMLLEEKRRKHTDAIEEKLEAGSTEDLAELIEKVEALDRELMLLPTKSFAEISKLFTLEQRARFVLAREKLHRDVRRTLHRRFERRDRGSRGETPPPRE